MTPINVPEQAATSIRFTHYENGIHAYTFLEATNAAVEQFFEMIIGWTERNIAQGLTADDTVYVLIDFRAVDTPSLNLFYQHFKAFDQRFPSNQRPRSRCAVLLQNRLLVTIGQVFISLITLRTQDELAIFSGDKAHDEATAWLLKGD